MIIFPERMKQQRKKRDFSKLAALSAPSVGGWKNSVLETFSLAVTPRCAGRCRFGSIDVVLTLASCSLSFILSLAFSLRQDRSLSLSLFCLFLVWCLGVLWVCRGSHYFPNISYANRERSTQIYSTARGSTYVRTYVLLVDIGIRSGIVKGDDFL